jgi:hypothetical protein
MNEIKLVEDNLLIKDHDNIKVTISKTVDYKIEFKLELDGSMHTVKYEFPLAKLIELLD